MSQAVFREQVAPLTARIAGRRRDVALEAWLTHRPTVSNGRLLVLRLLPAGRIEFTG